MGQNDVLEWLREQHKKDKEKWFTVAEIRQGLLEKGCSELSTRRTTQHLFTLNGFNMIECTGKGFWNHYKLFKYNDD